MELKISQSSIYDFLACRRKYWFAHVERIEPIDRAPALTFGTAVHAWLAGWFAIMGGVEYDFDATRVMETMPVLESAQEQLIIEAIMRSFRFDLTGLKVLAVEQKLEMPLNDSVKLVGMADLVLKNRGNRILVEHKTASLSSLKSPGYFAKLWNDYQIWLYAAMLGLRERDWIYYHVIPKPGFSMAQGETEAEFECRLAKLRANNKSGKSNAKRKMPETAGEYGERLNEFYRENPPIVHMIPVSMERIETAVHEIVQIAADIERCVSAGSVHYGNPKACYTYGRCPYEPICSQPEDNQKLIKQNLYTSRDREVIVNEQQEEVF